ncbi:hypothetical protein CYCD_02650 [Tenuifilaceae bacterium CYCD]|nr:hypothetical protein CYCD_02650 [Tenuifilaceae bacterium CYCD]
MRKLYFIVSILTLLIYSCEDNISSFQSNNFIKFFGGGNGSYGSSCVEIPGEGFIFTGYDITTSGNKQVYAAKTDLYGNVVWENTFISDDSIQEGQQIKHLDDGNSIIVGSSKISASATSSPFMLKIDSYGDLIWKKNFIVNYNLLVNDIAITTNNIFLVGESYRYSASLPDTYIAKYNLDGTIVDTVTKGNVLKFETFKKIFTKSNGDIIVVGNSNLSGSASLVTISEYGGSLSTPKFYKELDAEKTRDVKDAIYADNCFYLLIYEDNVCTKVLKRSSDYPYPQIWETESISNFKGKSITLSQNGELFIVGEYGNQIQFVEVDSQGAAYYGAEVFLTYPGSVGKIINTVDNGLLVVGSTTSAYNSMVQLIKTGSDLYLLKP